jgi:hypothetical protein
MTVILKIVGFTVPKKNKINITTFINFKGRSLTSPFYMLYFQYKHLINSKKIKNE